MRILENQFRVFFDDCHNETIESYLYRLNNAFTTLWGETPKFNFFNMEKLNINELVERIITRKKKKDRINLGFGVKKRIEPFIAFNERQEYEKWSINICFSEIPYGYGYIREPFDKVYIQEPLNKLEDERIFDMEFINCCMDNNIGDLFYFNRKTYNVFGKAALLYLYQKCMMSQKLLDSMEFRHGGISIALNFKRLISQVLLEDYQLDIIHFSDLEKNLNEFMKNCDNYLLDACGEKVLERYLKEMKISLKEWLKL